MTDLKFSQDWNNKLFGDYFSTIRLKGSYIINDIYNVYLKQGKDMNLIFQAKIMSVENRLLKDFPPNYFQLDLGQEKSYSLKIFETMYKHKNIDFDTQEFSYIILKRIR